jgi:hypothetical protein
MHALYYLSAMAAREALDVRAALLTDRGVDPAIAHDDVKNSIRARPSDASVSLMLEFGRRLPNLPRI